MGCYGNLEHLKGALKKKKSNAASISRLKVFMTRKGKASVKCVLAKSMVSTLEEDILGCTSTYHLSLVLNPMMKIYPFLPGLLHGALQLNPFTAVPPLCELVFRR
ncbi:macrophage scavenger receptor types I and II [Platysternon megacephalum]|uniref:Macrophage scavenger receptor types I and II n=1 Tax=Platysternon megacephalum TaxID=55544 RepID=A0A4D9FBB9_9SAUR|nr:macrophage scavenger receptor types I and II [Platysternon megacephalum]